MQSDDVFDVLNKIQMHSKRKKTHTHTDTHTFFFKTSNSMHNTIGTLTGHVKMSLTKFAGHQ